VRGVIRDQGDVRLCDAWQAMAMRCPPVQIKELLLKLWTKSWCLNWRAPIESGS
jgi:hypothetical protein